MPKSSDYLKQIATRHQVYLERLKAGSIKSWEKAVSDLEKAIIQVVKLIDDDSISSLSRRSLEKLLSKLQVAQEEVLVRHLSQFSDELEELANYEAGFEARSLKSAIDVEQVAVAKKAYQAALRNPLSTTGELLEPFISDWKRKEIKAVNDTVRKAWSEGWTVQELTQAIRGTKALGYSDGLVAGIGNRAKTVARTSIQHVASTARMQTLVENSDILDGYVWVSTLDGRTSQTCRSLDGKFFQFGKGPTPPIHPNCRSTMVPELNDEYDFLREGGTRASKDGPVDSDLSYYEWLKTQSPEFQDSALGPARGQLFREGGLSAEKFAKLNLGRNFQPLTLEEMRKLEPLAFEKAGL